MQEAREKLESEMEDAYHEHQANLLRQGKLGVIIVRIKKDIRLYILSFSVSDHKTICITHDMDCAILSATIKCVGLMFPVKIF